MDKNTKLFLLVTYAVSYACFGLVIASGLPLTGLDLPRAALFLLGCLGPLAGAVAVYLADRENSGGLRGLLRDAFSVTDAKKGGLYAALFLGLHYGLAVLLGVAVVLGRPSTLLRYLPLMLVLFGTGEIGWRGIVQPGIEKTRGGFWRSSVITGLLWAMWFLPMVFIPGFVVFGDFFMQFAAYLVGATLLLTTVRKQGGMLFCLVFTTLFFALSSVVILGQSNYLLALVAVDLVLAMLYNYRLFQ